MLSIINQSRPAIRKMSSTIIQEKRKIAYLIVVLHNLPLQLATIDPSDVVLHIPHYEECWIGDGVWTHPDVPLFDKRHRCTDGFCHFHSDHHDCQSPSAKGCDSDLVVYRGQCGC